MGGKMHLKVGEDETCPVPEEEARSAFRFGGRNVAVVLDIN